jgi:DNA-binding HxlR family transcriptional regulator
VVSLDSRRGGAVTTVSHEVGFLRDPSAHRRRPAGSGLDLIDHVDRALEVLQGKWKVHLLFSMARGVRRHSKLLECLPGASKKVMTDSLRALERDGIVTRRIFPEVPARVEYSLTRLGWTITEPLVALADWGDAHAKEVAEARSVSSLDRSRGNGRASSRALSTSRRA